MIDIERIVEQLRAASMDSEDVAAMKMKLILNLALQNQCNEDLNIIFKYLNQWNKTKALSINGDEDNDPTARLIRLLFSLITDDINDVVKEYERTLSKNV